MQGKSNIRWAMAARNEARLERVRSDLAKTYPGMKVTTDLSPQILLLKCTALKTIKHVLRCGPSKLPLPPEGGLIGISP